MSKMQFTFDEPAVGTDAEVFLKNKEGKHVSSVGIIGGRKGAPIKCEYGGYLEDCVAVEINVHPTKESEGAAVFSSRVNSCLGVVRNKAKELDLAIDIAPAALFDSASLGNSQANISGCSPSYYAWELTQTRPVDLELTNVRFAGGDIHLSWPDVDETRYGRVNVARAMDMLLGLWEVTTQERSERLAGYGAPGIHRPTSYGVEYKSIGNFWLTSPSLRKEAFRRALSSLYVAKDLMNGEDKLILEEEMPLIKQIRSDWDGDRAYIMLDRWGYAPF